MVKDSFAFAKEIVEKDSELFIGSIDVDSYFTNISTEETIDICANIPFENTKKIGLSKTEFKELLFLTTKESYFVFNRKLYKQVQGVAMGSPLDAFLVHFQKKLITKLSI